MHAAATAHTCTDKCGWGDTCCDGVLRLPSRLAALQIMQLYKDYIDPEFSWQNFTVEEQAKVIVAPRSNNLLDTERVRGCGTTDGLV